MRSTMLTILMTLSTMAAMAQDSDVAIGRDKSAVEKTSDTAESPVAAATKVEAIKPPHGFVTKKRGDKVLYCMRDSTVGTRFKTEKCYDEKQMKDYLLAREQNNRDFDRSRAICSNPAVCAPQ